LKPTENLSALPSGSAVGCDVVAFGTARATADTLPALRHQPGPPLGEPLPASFLKHADEQTVVALAAALQAIHRHGLTATSFTDWGVLAAPRFLGREALAGALQRFATEGAWGISPHVIPHHSLHSLSGTISQALKIHGPNFGVGGGPDSAAEGLLTAAALLARDRLPGVWVVWSGWDPEPTPGRNGHLAPPTVCAAALALVAGRPDWDGPKLRLAASSGAAPDPHRNGHHRLPQTSELLKTAETWRSRARSAFSLESLLMTLTDPGAARETEVWHLNGSGWVEWQRAQAGTENRL
jgi:hypothetical protein